MEEDGDTTHPSRSAERVSFQLQLYYSTTFSWQVCTLLIHFLGKKWSKNCLKRSLSKRSKIGFQDQLLLMPRLHLPYSEYSMSKSPFPCGLRRETLRLYGFMGTVASTILFNSAQWQINNFQILVIISCLFHFNICLLAMSLIQPLRVTQYGPRSVCWLNHSNQGP